MVHKIEEEIRCKETQRFNMLISELPHSHIMLVNTTFTITIFQETMFTLREMFLCSLTINVLQPYCLTRPTDRSGSTISENFCLLHVPSSENPKHHYIMFHYICALFSKHIQTSIIPVPLTALVSISHSRTGPPTVTQQKSFPRIYEKGQNLCSLLRMMDMNQLLTSVLTYYYHRIGIFGFTCNAKFTPYQNWITDN